MEEQTSKRGQGCIRLSARHPSKYRFQQFPSVGVGGIEKCLTQNREMFLAEGPVILKIEAQPNMHSTYINFSLLLFFFISPYGIP